MKIADIAWIATGPGWRILLEIQSQNITILVDYARIGMQRHSLRSRCKKCLHQSLNTVRVRDVVARSDHIKLTSRNFHMLVDVQAETQVPRVCIKLNFMPSLIPFEFRPNQLLCPIRRRIICDEHLQGMVSLL